MGVLMREVFLFTVIFLVGRALCGVDRGFEPTEDVEEFQIPDDDSNTSDGEDGFIEESEAGDSSETYRLWTKVLRVNNGGPWGTWGNVKFCPGDSYAVGYDMKIEPKEHNDNTALNAIKLICANERGRYTGEVTSTQGRWGSWVGRINCNGHRHLAAFDLQVEKPQGRGDDTAANYVKFKCRCHGGHAYELVKPPGHGLWGKWGAWSDTCPKGSGICGIQTKVEKCQWHGDDTALNDVAFYCCKLPCNSDSLSD